VLGVALVFAAVWWGRNLIVYGFPDFLGLEAHDEVVVGQLRTTERIADRGLAGVLARGLPDDVQQLLGATGLDGGCRSHGNWYPPIGLMLLAAAGGLAIFDVIPGPATQGQATDRPSGDDWDCAGVVRACWQLAQFVYYNITFYQVQGRYLFVALVPFTLLVAAGLDGWVQWIGTALRRPLPSVALVHGLYLTPLALAAVFGAMNLWLIRFVLPALAP
jgi:hypothetical protein